MIHCSTFNSKLLCANRARDCMTSFKHIVLKLALALALTLNLKNILITPIHLLGKIGYEEHITLILS